MLMYIVMKCNFIVHVIYLLERNTCNET